MTAARRRNLDLRAPASRFIGRASDRAALLAALEDGARVITVWGPAGMGKTRLAIEVARAFAEGHPDDAVRFCDVTAARDLRALSGAVARSLGLAVAAGKKDDAGTVERLGERLAAEGPLLLVLDNLEQVIEPAAQVIAAFCEAAPGARFLVTSRERLRIAGELCYELPPLALPEQGRAESGSEAVELFLDRARSFGGSRAEGDEVVAKIGALVRRLEGIPLAIELCAARADVLGLDGLGARLGRRLDLLGGARGVSARQATLRGAIEWSWDLLDEDDRGALSRFSVFRGGFTLDAADAVLGGAAFPRLQSLRDKSLLRVVAREPAAPRFALYEGVRELAEDKLGERGEAAIAADRHAAHYLESGEAAAADWERSGAVAALDRIGDDLDNHIAVVERSLSAEAAERALRALLVVDPLLGTRGPFGIHLELLERALALAEAQGAPAALVARAVAARGRARHLRGRDDAGLEDLTRARDLAAALGSPSIEASILTDLGVVHQRRRDVAAAHACYEDALALHGRAGDRRAEGRVLGNLGALAHDERRFDEARRLYREALGIAAAAGDLRTEGIFTGNLGLLEQERNEAAEARRRYERAVTILEAVGDLRLLGITLGNLGSMDHEEGRLAEARASHERAAGLLREAGDRRSEALAEARLGAVLASLEQLDEARAALGRADRLLVHAGDPLASELGAVARGFLALALARAARVAGRDQEAAAEIAEARRRAAHAREGSPSICDRSDDVRLCVRVLERGLSALDATAAAPALELLLSSEARFFRPPGGSWQDLRERHAVRRLLLCLVERRRREPGRGLSLAELQEAGWPGERILPQAASNRIYVAMNQLRKLGLKDWLRRSGEGYFLDPALPVHHASTPPLVSG